MDRSVNAPAVSPDLITKAVYYAGSDEVKEGEPFVYDTGHGTATEYDGYRHNKVVRPTASGQTFAGVATRNYPAADPGNGRLIEIALPGSRGVRIRMNAAIDAGDRALFCYKATVGSKLWKETATAVSSGVIGMAVIRQTTAGAGLAQADLLEAAYGAGQSES
jgi:hypothetical protein